MSLLHKVLRAGYDFLSLPFFARLFSVAAVLRKTFRHMVGH
ncbi:MAG: hypothetical protein RIS80_822 [Actinomycetota bacterium]